MLDRFSEASKVFGHTISLAMTKVLCQSAPDTNAVDSFINIDTTTALLNTY